MAATSMRPQTAATTIAPSTARGRSVKNHVNRISTMTTRTAETRPETWLVAPARDGGRRLRETAGHRHPAGEPGGDVRSADADELSLGLDPVAALLREQSGCRQPFRDGDEGQRRAGERDGGVVVPRDQREPEGWQPGRDLADGRHALGAEVQEPPR